MKEKILQKSVELFFGHGIKETTMDHIAQELGISKKTLYKYFENKDLLVKEATFFLSEKIMHGLDKIQKENANPYESFFQIRQMINTLVKQVNLIPYKQLKSYYPELSREIEKRKREKIFRFLDNNFDKGISLGYYKKNINRDFFKKMFFGCKHILHDPDFFPPDPVKSYQYNTLFLKLFLQAISTKKGKQVLKKTLKKYEV